MLSKLIDARISNRTNGDEFFVCTFESSVGDKNAETFLTLPDGTKVLNTKVASMRTLRLTKCLFPTEDANALAYAKALKGFCKCIESETKSFKDSKGIERKIDEFTFSLPLIYATKSVAEVSGGLEFVYYLDKDGNEQKLTNCNAIGYSIFDVEEMIDTDVWDKVANGGTVDEVIKRNFDNNMANGVYYTESIEAPVKKSADEQKAKVDEDF